MVRRGDGAIPFWSAQAKRSDRETERNHEFARDICLSPLLFLLVLFFISSPVSAP
ncbi:hypothetical protein BH20ACI3_BH20ACI3_15070 [soil metagenome]